MRRVLIIGLPILFILAGIPAAGQVPPGERALRMGEAFRAAPAVHWSAEGLLVYSVAHGDSVAVRAVDQRTGSERPCRTRRTGGFSP